MASNLSVFEVMIHRVDADDEEALLLQQRLRRNGIRAGIAGLSAANPTRSARHSLLFIGAASGDDYLASVACQNFDSVFIGPGAGAVVHGSKACLSYKSLVDRIARGRRSTLISAPELRRMTCESYDAIADQFTDVWFDYVPGEAVETLLRYLPRGASILDAGCGPGHHARFFWNAGFNPVGIDFSRTMIEIAMAKNNHIPFNHGDVLSYALPPAHYDGVWSAIMLNHVPLEDLPLALERLVATLKWHGFIGLNFQIGRISEIVSQESDHRFFEYPADEKGVERILESLGVVVVATHFGTTTMNIHQLPLEMHFATVVGRKLGKR